MNEADSETFAFRGGCALLERLVVKTVVLGST